MTKKKLRLAGFEVGITKNEYLELSLVAILYVFLAFLLSLFEVQSSIFIDLILPILFFPISMNIVKFFKSRKFLNSRENISGLIRGIILISIAGILKQIPTIVEFFARSSQFEFSIYLFLMVVSAGIIAEFTIDPILKIK